MAACEATVRAVIRYIEEFAGEKQAWHKGAEILADNRRSHVGTTVERDADDTLWLVHHDPMIDGWGEWARALPNGDDDGFGNSNADIIEILRAVKNGHPAADLKPFKVS